jgi:hypothetical protein
MATGSSGAVTLRSIDAQILQPWENLQNHVLDTVSADDGEMTGTIEVAPSVSYDVAGTWTAPGPTTAAWNMMAGT